MKNIETPQGKFRESMRLHSTAFTLVELLVVIGIIALLISILLPSLTAARRAAQRTACAAKLNQILVAANLHAVEHQGYYPLAGVIGDCTPWGVDDRNKQRYTYFSPTGFPSTPNAYNVIAPVTFALSNYMGFKSVMDIHENVGYAKAETDPAGLIKNFWCPSVGESIADSSTVSALMAIQPILIFGRYSADAASYAYGQSSGYIVYQEAQTYLFNEQVMGLDDNLCRLRGKASLVKQPSKTVLVSEGFGSSIDKARSSTYGTTGSAGFVMCTMYSNMTKDKFRAPVTMGDMLSGVMGIGLGFPKAADAKSFDFVRHRGKINVACCDGHVELRNMTIADLQNINLMTP